MDGNGRWAKRKHLPKIEGHRRGVAAVEEIVKACREFGVKVLTLYTFSTENWRRPRAEVQALMRLLDYYLKIKVEELNKNKVRLIFSGRKQKLPEAVQKKISWAEDYTKDNAALILNLALNYGGREEILDAVQAIADKVKNKRLNPEQINERVFCEHLYSRGLPDPDLLIRTSGELRLSNFLLWQLSYSELYFTPKLWPDFNKQDLAEAIKEFSRRQRRFGAR